MQQRPVVVTQGNNATGLGILAIVVIAAVIALVVWQPWNTQRPVNNTTIVNPGSNPGAGSNAGSNGGSGSQSSGSQGSGGSSSSGSGSSNP